MYAIYYIPLPWHTKYGYGKNANNFTGYCFSFGFLLNDSIYFIYRAVICNKAVPSLVKNARNFHCANPSLSSGKREPLDRQICGLRDDGPELNSNTLSEETFICFINTVLWN